MLLGGIALQTAKAQPYPASGTQLTFDWSTFKRFAPGSDNWPTTWAADGTIYSAWGDGSGVAPRYDPKYRVSMGIAALSGTRQAAWCRET